MTLSLQFSQPGAGVKTLSAGVCGFVCVCVYVSVFVGYYGGAFTIRAEGLGNETKVIVCVFLCVFLCVFVFLM